MNGIRSVGFFVAIIGVVMIASSDFWGVLLIVFGVPLIFYDLVAYYVKLKIFFKLNKQNEDSKYHANPPRAQKPRRPKI
jgi:hypothetical protein